MTVPLMSTRIVQIAYLFFLIISLANATVINRPADDDRRVGQLIGAGDIDDAIVQIAEIIDDGNNPKAAVLYDILEDILAPPAVKPTQPMASIKKRTCYFNAGMSHNCDYNEVLKTVDDVNHWSSDSTPGRRRKRQHARRGTRGRGPTRSMLDVLTF